MPRKMNRFEALILAAALLDQAKVFMKIDDETGVVTVDSFWGRNPQIEYLPDEYSRELTKIVVNYNKDIKELALKIVDDYEE